MKFIKAARLDSSGRRGLDLCVENPTGESFLPLGSRKTANSSVDLPVAKGWASFRTMC
jgi:hypothetical protein